MNAVDIAIIVLLVSGAVLGFRRGLIMQVAAILGAVVALAVAKAEYGHGVALLQHVASNSRWLIVISYLVIFFIVWSAINFVARLVKMAAKLLLLGLYDRLLGALIGLLQSALIVELLLYLGKRSPGSTIHSAIKHSSWAPAFMQVVPLLDKLFPHIPR